MRGWVSDTGYDEIQEIEKIVPIGNWPKNKRLKEIGLHYLVHLLIGERVSNSWLIDLTISGMEHYSMAIFTRNGWMAEEVQVLLAHVRNEVLSNKLHTYTKA
jgi:hypothetical protein